MERRPIRIVVAPNAFKESLSAPAAAKAMARGVRRAYRDLPDEDLEILQVPLADGGDGTMEALVAARGGRFCADVEACDPLLRPLQTRYGIVEEDEGPTAVIEMAQTSGLALLKAGERDPTRTSTYGTGLVVRAALEAGCSRILLTIGGSATTDGGIGLAAALGYRFLDAAGRELPRPTGADMARVARIDGSGVHPLAAACRIVAACDVGNPLLGPRGAAAVFGPQKGASPEGVRALEAGLSHLASLWERDLGVPPSVKEAPGAGAAGGLGAGLRAFLRAELRPGFELVAGVAGLDAALAGARLVLTGEGRIDASTADGKVPHGVAVRAAGAGSGPVVALGGSVAPPEELSALHDAGLAAAVSIAEGPGGTLDEALAAAPRLLEAAAEQVARIHRASASGGPAAAAGACPACGRPRPLGPPGPRQTVELI